MCPLTADATVFDQYLVRNDTQTTKHSNIVDHCYIRKLPDFHNAKQHTQCILSTQCQVRYFGFNNWFDAQILDPLSVCADERHSVYFDSVESCNSLTDRWSLCSVLTGPTVLAWRRVWRKILALGARPLRVMELGDIPPRPYNFTLLVYSSVHHFRDVAIY